MKTVTLFTFGYYGWGNHTPELVQAVDAVEQARGFAPPMFVDIRIRRSVRAAGFRESAFEKLLGISRHRWMKSLGNKFIETKTGPSIQIAEPKAALELLDLALELHKHKQRLLFFCSCSFPRQEGKIACHRATVAGLVLKAAKQRNLKVEIVEWPGGKQKHLKLQLSAKDFAAVKKGRGNIPLGDAPDLAITAGLPWLSTVTLQSEGEKLHRTVCPAFSATRGWCFPVAYTFPDEEANLSDHKAVAEKYRKSLGLNPLSSG